MNRYNILLILQMLSFQFLSSQDFGGLAFGSDATFEIITWNIEQFPKNGETTVNYVSDIIEALDVDIIAIQEVSDITAFNQMVNNLSAYDAYLESLWFGGLAYIYKPATVTINSIYEIYTTSEYWSYFPRSPMVMDLNYMGERIIVINNHYKCCGDGVLNISNLSDEETRRYYANTLLKEYIDLNFTDENVIVLGDLNDSLMDITENNVFQMLISDTDNYLFTDYAIASGSTTNWSFPSWPSHLDHILITNELFDEFEAIDSDIQTIKIEDHLSGGWVEYDENISDHRPVALKLPINDGLSVSETSKLNFKNYPNPFKFETTITFDVLSAPYKIEIYNMNGQKITTLPILDGQSSVTLDAASLTSGIYIAKLFSNTFRTVNRKIVVLK